MSVSLILEKAVEGMCARLSVEKANRKLSERELWGRLTTCVLSSQVSYGTAQAAANHVEGIIFSSSTDCAQALEAALSMSLREPMNLNGRQIRYRFPNAKAKQIAKTWVNFDWGRKSLRAIAYSDVSEETARTVLIQNVVGMGPKQASMFLRDIGAAKDLAIIDRHILDYMRVTSLADVDPKALTSKTYWDIEECLRDYAHFLGHPLSLVDHAIWLITREAKREAMI